MDLLRPALLAGLLLVSSRAAAQVPAAPAAWAEPPVPPAAGPVAPIPVGPVAPVAPIPATPVPVGPAPVGTVDAVPVGPVAVAPPEPPRLKVAGLPLPTPSRGGDRVGVALGITFGIIGAVDVGFGAWNAVVAGRQQVLPVAPAVVQEVLVAPQVIVFGIAHPVLLNEGGERDPWPVAALVLAPGIANSLALNAALNSTPRSLPPAALYGASWALGFDVAFTIPALTAAGKGHLFSRALGAVEMALTAPQIAAASYGIVKDRQHLADWAPLAGWSSALFVHGLLSVAIPPKETPPVPPPPPEPPKAPLQVPVSMEVAPASIAHGGGLSVRGRFW